MISEFEKYAVDAVIDFYGGDSSSIVSYLDDNVIWSGPGGRPFWVGRQSVVSGIRFFNTLNISCEVKKISSRLVTYANSYHLILLNITLLTRRDGREEREYSQSIVIAAHKCRDMDGSVFWRCNFVQISNSLRSQVRFSENELETLSASPEPPDLTPRIKLPVESHGFVYIPADKIVAVEGAKKVGSIVHTDRESLAVNKMLKDIEPLLPDYFYRPHSSYIINLRRVKYVSGGEIVLDTDRLIPIPARKSAQIRRFIDAFMLSPK
ncbi:MAG: LytTR family transcriptional regulator [Clostridia bacterium]|nr:LytTR family transcriptional regulator [Clostridia bacterium]